MGSAAIITAALYTAGIIVVPLAAVVLATKLSIAGFAVGGAMVGSGLIGTIIKICSGLRGKKRTRQAVNVDHVEAFTSSNAKAARMGIGGTQSGLSLDDKPVSRERSGTVAHDQEGSLREVSAAGQSRSSSYRKK